MSRRAFVQPEQVQAIAITYEKLARVFGSDNIAVIGGMAVNLYCDKKKRYTHDLDLAIRGDPDKKRAELIKERFVIEEDGAGRVKRVIDLDAGMSADLTCRWGIRGIPVETMLESAVKKEVLINGEMKTFTLVGPALLVLMKYAAGREKDYTDIQNIVANATVSGTPVYDSPSEFLERDEALLRHYLEFLDDPKGVAYGTLRADLSCILTGSTAPYEERVSYQNASRRYSRSDTRRELRDALREARSRGPGFFERMDSTPL